MKERPILFNRPMVRAILEGRKTQTRRVASKQVLSECHPNSMSFETWCPYGKPGDRLWVREAWNWGFIDEDGIARYAGNRRGIPSQKSEKTFVVYAADGEENFYKPSIHMPRWASRITLEVTGVRVERVQEITEDDARAEGVEPKPDAHIASRFARGEVGPTQLEFYHLWDSINAKRGYSWESNPWVWVVSFRRVEEGQ